jgi:hypothetical protein
VSVEVIDPKFEKTILKSLDILNETSTKIDNTPAVKITNNLGLGFTETVILATQNNKLYVIRGTDSLVQKLMSGFRFRSMLPDERILNNNPR